MYMQGQPNYDTSVYAKIVRHFQQKLSVWWKSDEFGTSILKLVSVFVILLEVFNFCFVEVYFITCVKIHAWDKDIIEKDIQPSYYPI
jgi:hypothetical protein